MTTKTFPNKTFSEQPEDMRRAAPGSSLTWHTLAGQWLRSPAAQVHDTEALVRRQAAVQRWRGLPPEATPCPEICRP